MGCLWRASKSRLVSQIRNAKNNAERMKLRPKNIPTTEWRKFVRLKTSAEFKVVSDKYKERRRNQIPHTCSRRGMVRLAEDLKKESSDPSVVTRVKVWVRSRTKKDGTAVNTTAAEKMKKAADLVETGTHSSTSTNPKEDALAQILGPDNPGRLRAMGRGMNMSKLACFQVKKKYMAEMQKNQADLQKQVQELQDALNKMSTQRPETEIGENSAARSVNNRSQPKCLLFDWDEGDDKVAEGRLLSSDPDDFVSDIRLGPSSVKVLVETAFKSEAFLWRPAPNMFTIEESVGGIIAWPKDFAVVLDQYSETLDTPPTSPNTNSQNSCKLLDWDSNNKEVVAEGRWQSKDNKALVNGLPLGPKAVKIFIDKVIEPDTYLWRPTADLTNLSDCLKSFVSWPVSRVVFSTVNVDSPYPVSPLEQSALTPPAPTKKSQTSSQSHTRSSPDHISQQGTRENVANENKKCMLMDVTGKNRVVAEGRWTTNNPDQKVHFVPLGSKAVCVWVEVVKVNDAVVWRPSSAIECMEDALGTTVAWPEDKVLII